MGLPHDNELVSDAVKMVGGNTRSPLVLAGIMMEVLRHRFRSKERMGFIWEPRDDDPYMESPASTLRIEVGGQSTNDLAYAKPGIYVVRQPTHVVQLVKGNEYKAPLETGDVSYIAMAKTGFTFVCETNEEGSSSMLGDLVLSTLMQGKTLIERVFNLHNIGPFSVSATTSTRKEKEVFETHVSVGLEYHLQWVNLQLAPMFKEIVLKSSDNEKLFIESYTKSLKANQEA